MIVHMCYMNKALTLDAASTLWPNAPVRDRLLRRLCLLFRGFFAGDAASASNSAATRGTLSRGAMTPASIAWPPRPIGPAWFARAPPLFAWRGLAGKGC